MTEAQKAALRATYLDEGRSLPDELFAPNLQWLIPVSPPCTSFACGSISRSADLSVAWTGAASSSVLLLLNSSSTAANKTTFVQCSATSSPFLISAAVLAKLGPTDAGFGNLLLMYPYNVTTFTAAGYVVSLEVASHGSGGNFTTSN